MLWRAPALQHCNDHADAQDFEVIEDVHSLPPMNTFSSKESPIVRIHNFAAVCHHIEPQQHPEWNPIQPSSLSLESFWVVGLSLQCCAESLAS